MHKLWDSCKEVLVSVLPMTVLIILLAVTIVPVTPEMMVTFIGGSIMLMFGLTLFLFGAELSMQEVGRRVGTYMVKRRSLVIFIVLAFLIGLALTIAEPDIQVLADQFAGASGGAMSRHMLLVVFGIGVGALLVVALLRIVFHVKLTYVFTIGYIIAFTLAFFSNQSIVPIAFDSGGATTGPLSVPLLLALGTGVASNIRSDKETGDQSFGIVGIASLGSITALLVLGVMYR